MKRIQTGDYVIVTTGRSKGHKGLVKKVSTKGVIVEGANFQVKNVKPNPQLQQKGGIIKREAPIHVSNIALVNPVTKEADKVGFKFVKDGETSKKVRYFKSNDELVVKE